MEFLLAPGNIPFVAALLLMVLIAVFEGVLAVLGFGLSSVLDSVLPEVDFDPSVEAGPGGLSRLLGWLHVGSVPALVLLVLFLTAFGIAGLFFQLVSQALLGGLLPAIVAVAPAGACALPVVRGVGGLLARVAIRDESDALPRDSFVGHVATITLGIARPGSPAEARFRDSRGTTHYVMVEPDEEGQAFQQGEKVLLVSTQGAVFKGIRAENKNLTN